jgi:uncharacterized membrane protein YfcA
MQQAEMIQQALVLLVIFLAVFTQSFAGFGVALIAMALLPGLIGLQLATPLVALIAETIEIFLLIRYRHALNLAAIWPVTLASLPGIPLGIWALTRVPEGIVLSILGVVIAGYALYALLNLHLPNLENRLWAYSIGLVAGMLGGAYNTSGPPVIVYGNCRRWPPTEFKSNLQAFFFVSSAFILLGHFIAGTITGAVFRQYVWSLPVLGLAIVGGTTLDHYLDPLTFRKIVLLLLFVMGVRLVF